MNGAVYVVTGANPTSIMQMETEVLRSSRLLRHYHPQLPQTVILGEGVSKGITEAFDSYKVLSKEHNMPGMVSKILALAYSPYEEGTLILDNDTLPVGNIIGGFDYIKGRRQLALSLAPRQEMAVKERIITHFQNGVMFVQKTERMLDLFSRWYKMVCSKGPQTPTRYAFSRLLSKFDDISIYPLPYYWNFRVDLLLDFNVQPKELGRVLRSIKVFHTHLKRQNAINIVRQSPKLSLIRKIAKVSI